MTAPAPSPTGPTAPPRFARTDICPDCSAPLAGPRCPRCGLELVGPSAFRLLDASRQADGWLAERTRLVHVLRAEQRSRRAAPSVLPATVAPPPWEAPAAHPHQPVRQPAPQPLPQPLPQPVARPQAAGWAPPATAAPAPARGSVLSVQTLLVGLGALLLAVASIVFLAFSWDRLGVSGRSAVVAAMTVTVLGGAVLARRARMVLTAEAVGALGAVLVVLDAVAVRITGLAGEGTGALSYAAAAAAVCAAVLAGVARLGRLRSAGAAAAALVPLSPLLLGVHLALRADGASVLAWTVLGLLGASAVALGAGALTDRGARVEGGVLRWTGAAAAASAAPLLLALVVWSPDLGALTAAAAALVAAAHACVPGRRAERLWAAAAGALGAVALASAALHLLDSWALVGAPMAAGALALALRLLAAHQASGAGGAGGRVLVSARSALVVLGVVVVPAAAVVLVHPVAGLGGAGRPWASGLGTSFGEAAGILVAGEVVDGTERTASFAAVVVLAGVLASWWRVSGTTVVRRLATVSVAALVVSLPWQVQLPVLTVVTTAAVLAVAAVAGGWALRRHARGWDVDGTVLLAAGATVGTLGVLAAWTVEPLSVPVTLAGVAALVLARRACGQALLLLPAAASGLVAVGAVVAWTDVPLLDAVLVGGLTGLLLVVGASAVPALPASDRRVLAGTGAAGVLVAFGPALAAGDRGGRPVLALAVLAATALVVAVDPRRTWTVAERVAGAVAAVPVLALLASRGLRLADLPAVDPGLPAALVVAAALAVAATLHRAGSPLALGTEVSAAATGVVVLVGAAAAAVGTVDGQPWQVLLVLAAGCAVLSLLPSRRWVAWVALGLASLALWDRLGAADVGTVEAFSLPPALVLLVAGTLAARRDGTVLRPSLVAGALALVLPTAVAAVGGPAWRPALVLVASGAAVALARVAGAGSRTRVETAVLLLGSAAVATVVGPLVRAVGGTDAASTELWSVPSALVLVGAALVLRTSRPRGLGGWDLVPALAAGVLPSLLHASSGTDAVDLLRHLAALAVCAGVLVATAAGERLRPLGWSALGLLVLALVAGLGRDLLGPVELLTVPAGAALLAAGALRMRREPALGSWPWAGPGAAVALLPSLVLSATGGSVLRVALLAVGTAGLLLVAVRLRWQAPVVLASLVLAVHAVVQLAPWVAAAYQVVPRWATLAVVGAVLLAVGARYEARVRDVVGLRRRVASLR